MSYSGVKLTAASCSTSTLLDRATYLWLYAGSLVLRLLGALSLRLLLGGCLLLLGQLLAMLIHLWNILGLLGLPLSMDILQQTLRQDTGCFRASLSDISEAGLCASYAQPRSG